MIKYPHDDAIIINLIIDGYEIRRTLIDSGSSANILFFDPFQKISRKEGYLLPSNTIVSGFIREVNAPKGKMKLPVTISSDETRRTILINFFIKKVKFPYNAIMGRPWLNDIGAIVSSYHQCLKYLIRNLKGVVRGS